MTQLIVDDDLYHTLKIMATTYSYQEKYNLFQFLWPLLPEQSKFVPVIKIFECIVTKGENYDWVLGQLRALFRETEGREKICLAGCIVQVAKGDGIAVDEVLDWYGRNQNQTDIPEILARDLMQLKKIKT